MPEIFKKTEKIFDIDKLSELDFSQSRVETVRTRGKNVPTELELLIVLNESSKLRAVQIAFGVITEYKKDGELRSFEGAEATAVFVQQDVGQFRAEIILEKDGKTADITLKCAKLGGKYMRYFGMSYKNMYGTRRFENYRQNLLNSVKEKYYMETNVTALDDGYSLEESVYAYANLTFLKLCIKNCSVRDKNGIICEYQSFYSRSSVFRHFIEHKNGHKYYPFQVDLYGICYLELDTKQVYCYVPEGREHDVSDPCGESFIITDAHYDPSSDLIAYSGCYWAGNYYVMVGDFSEPMSFDPRLADARELIGEKPEALEFVGWTDGALVVKDEKNRRFSIKTEVLREKILQNAPARDDEPN